MEFASNLLENILALASNANVIDVVAIALLVLFTLDGVRRSFVVGTTQLVSILIALTVATSSYRQVAPLFSTVSWISPPVANLAGFGLVLAVSLLALDLVERRFLATARGMWYSLAKVPLVRPLLRPAMSLDRMLGFLPGLAQAALVVTFLLIPLRLDALPVLLPLNQAVEKSTVASAIGKRTNSLTPDLERLLNEALKAANEQTENAAPAPA